MELKELPPISPLVSHGSKHPSSLDCVVVKIMPPLRDCDTLQVSLIMG